MTQTIQGFILLLACALFTVSYANTIEVELTEDDVEILERLDNINKNANMIGKLLYGAPLADVLSSSSYLESVVAVSTSNLEATTKSLVAVDTIRACQINKEIQLHMIDLSGARYKFFDSMRKAIAPKCDA